MLALDPYPCLLYLRDELDDLLREGLLGDLRDVLPDAPPLVYVVCMGSNPIRGMLNALAIHDGEGKIPIISVGGWRTPAIMEKYVGSTCDAFAISRPLINNSGIVNKWIKDPDYLTNCISCNKCIQGQGIVVCRKYE